MSTYVLSRGTNSSVDTAKPYTNGNGATESVAVTPVETVKPFGAVSVTATVESAQAVKLTKREIEVLTLVIEGKSSKQVADQLFVSKRTVDFHLANIYTKLSVTNRVQAFREATRRGLIPYAIVGSTDL